MSNDIGVRLKINGEKEFNQSIESNVSTIKVLETELDKLTSKYGDNAKGMEALKAKNVILSKEIDTLKGKLTILDTQYDKEKAKLGELGSALDTAKKKFGENSVEAGKAETAYNKQNIIVDKLKATMNQTETAMNKLTNEISSNKTKMNEMEQGTRDAATGLDKLGTSADSASEKMDQCGEALKMSNLMQASQQLSQVGDKLIEFGNKAREAFDEVDTGEDIMLAKTGATGKAALELHDSYLKVSKSLSAATASFDDVGSAVGDVNTMFGYTGNTLNIASEDFLNFARINKIDVSEAVVSVARALGDSGEPLNNYKQLLDVATFASQKYGINTASLLETTTKYGAVMRNLGYSMNESVTMFALWNKWGVTTETAMAGLKKATSNWISEGKNAGEEFQKLL
ncbi:MAG: phage tail tape measure protein, partial [Coprobacillus sp.]